jgi:4-hydroxy-tetrahydrodipicolinate synthase
MLQGVLTAVVTPFRNGAVDEPAFARLLEAQIQARVTGVIVLGSTGEAATLTQIERERAVDQALDVCRGSGVQVWAGTGSNATAQTVEQTQAFAARGVHGCMIVAPYYNKPTQEGLFRHFEQVARTTDVPLIAYNVPGRTGVNVLPETVARLHELGRYVAIKEASGSLDQVSDLRARCDMTVLSGDDSLTLPMLALGATGVVSVVSNLVPGECRALVDAFAAGDLDAARRWHFRLLPLFRAAFWETNPAPIKMLLHLDGGRMAPETRLPLVPATTALRPRLEAVLQEAAPWRLAREPHGARP